MRTHLKRFRLNWLSLALIVAGGLCLPSPGRAASGVTLDGAATLIRPELSSVSYTNITIDTVTVTNRELIAVGQIPVLATNVDYQLIISNSFPVNIYYDTLILTNSPILEGGPYVCTDLMVTNISAHTTNIVTDIIPVGQIPVLATNIAYQLVITTPNIIQIYYDTLILTNATGSPFPGSPVGPYFCEELAVTNIVGQETNVTVIGSTCTLSNNPTYLIIATNTVIPEIQYYTLITTNLFFDPENSACWQTIYHTNFTSLTLIETNLAKVGTTCVVSNSLRAVTIVTNDIFAGFSYYILATTNLIFDPGDPRCWQTVYQTNLSFFTEIITNTSSSEVTFTFAGSETARGQVFLSKRGTAESFSVYGRDLLSGDPPGALGVFIGNSIFDPNWVNAGIMARAGTNNLYRLELSSPNGAPPTLGVSHITSLAGRLLQIRDQSSNVYAQAVIPGLVPVPSALSYNRRANMVRPTVAPSPRATGFVRARYNGVTGASYLEVNVRNLAAGNGYCIVFTTGSTPGDDLCEGEIILDRGRSVERYDTAKGEDLPFGIGNLVSTVADMAGINVFIVDAFGIIHLAGYIPGP